MIRGQRFELDLDSDGERDTGGVNVPLPAAFVGNVLEREPATPSAPRAPTLKSTTGFPEHKKRTGISRFKQQKAVSANDEDESLPASSSEQHVDRPASGEAKSWEEEEKERIDQENRRKLASMLPEEIEEERRELMQSLNPALLQRLLRRSNIDDGNVEQDLAHGPQPHEARVRQGPKAAKNVSFETSEAKDTARAPQAVPEPQDPPPESDAQLHDSMHFPRPQQPPDLDPTSDSFLQDLHDKYFPSLPSDPDKLEWMQTSSTRSRENPYDPSATAFDAKDIRFSFKGELIPPKTAAEIPVTAGLHHHGDAPDAAGYTIAELAHLARSTFAAQRCLAFQTLGRVLYRLSKGEFGDAGEPGADRAGAEETFGELARGLWHEVERLQVIQILVDESEGRGVGAGKHVSAKAYATEAVWLWRKGGGRRWKAA